MYMAQFDFTHQALDVALRKLLLRMSLPKETQQIDRVIEAFSQRYEACEPGLFGTSGEYPLNLFIHLTLGMGLSDRQCLCPCFQHDDAAYRRLQQAQQKQDVQGRLCAQYPARWRF